MISVLDIIYYSLLIFPLYLLISNYFIDKKSVDKEMIGLFLLFTINKAIFLSGSYAEVFTYGFLDVITLDLLTLFVSNRYSEYSIKKKIIVLYIVKFILFLLILIFKDSIFLNLTHHTYVLMKGFYVVTAIMGMVVIFSTVKLDKIKYSFASYILIETVASLMMQSSYVSLYKVLNIFSYLSVAIFLIILFLQNRIQKDDTIDKLNSRLDIVNVFLKILAISNDNSVITTSNFNKVFHRIVKDILSIIIKDFNWQSGALYIFENDQNSSEKIFACKGEVNSFIPLSISNDVSISMLKADARKVEIYKKTFKANESIFTHIFEISQIKHMDTIETTLLFTEKKQKSLMKRMGFSSYIKDILAIPLILNDELLGVVLLQNSKNETLESLWDEQKGDYISVSELTTMVLGNLINTNTIFVEYEKAKNAKQELDIARNIQESMLPENIPEFESIEVSGFMRPALEIGGDYFDVIELKDGNAAIMIGDISGKGLPAGMMMLVIRTIIHTIIKKINTPYDMVLYLSKVISEYLQSGKFITFIYMFWDKNLNILKYASCGHEHILIYRNKTKKVERIKSGGIALGILDDLDGYIEEKEIILEKDDVVLLYTDGITEARNAKGKFYELDKLQDEFGKLCVIEKGFGRLSSNKLKEKLLEDLDNFTQGSGSQYDDMTLVIVRKKG